MRVLSKVKFVALLMGSAAIFAGPAMAAEAVAPAADEAVSNRLDEVTVTARRRAESEQKVAAALTVVSGAELDRRNIQTVNDLENSVPNLEVTSQLGGGQPQFRIRGVGLTDYAANNTGTVGVYVDEVAYPYGSMTPGRAVRRGPDRGAARSAGHPLRAQHHGRRGQRHH
jgi:iron complex outermembrane recepter protein